MRTCHAAACVLALTLVACGDDDATGAGGAGSTSGGGDDVATASNSSSSGGGAAGGGDGGGATTTATTTSGSATGGAGGGGGAPPSWEGVDPLDGAGDVELVAGGFSFVEGPLWLPSLGVLRWSDIPAERIHELAADDVVTTWREDSGRSNGLALVPGDDRMIACEGGARRIAASPLGAPSFTLVADRFEGSRFNAPNDAIVGADGTIYVTDPDYGLPPQDHEIGFNGVYRIDAGGVVHLVDDGRVLPNGIALSPDGAVLYVADNGTSEVWSYAVAADGATSEGALLTATEPGPDGMTVDDAGNLYVTTQAGIDVRRADGSPWGVIPIPETPANCAFGGADRNVLHVTARTSLYRVQLTIPGPP